MKLTMALTALAAVLVLAPARSGSQPSDREKAIEHYDQAEAYFKAGTFDKAVEEYRKSYALEPAPLLLFNIGLAHEKQGQRDEAIAHYERYLQAEPKGIKATEALARSEALRRARDAAALEASTREAKKKALRARIDSLVSDGNHLQAVGELRALHALEATPTLLFEMAEAYRSAADSEAAMAEYRRYLETGDNTHATDARARLDELIAADKKKDDPDVGRPAPARAPRGSIILPVAVSGAAAVLLGIGTTFGLQSNSLKGELDEGIKEGIPPIDSSDPRFDSGRKKAITADIFFGVGAGAAVGAAYFWYRYLRSGGGEIEQPAAVVVPQGRGAAVRLSF